MHLIWNILIDYFHFVIERNTIFNALEAMPEIFHGMRIVKICSRIWSKKTFECSGKNLIHSFRIRKNNCL